jgi:hypothetical protein
MHSVAEAKGGIEISGFHGGEYEHDFSGMLRRVVW